MVRLFVYLSHPSLSWLPATDAFLLTNGSLQKISGWDPIVILPQQKLLAVSGISLTLFQGGGSAASAAYTLRQHTLLANFLSVEF